MVRNLPISQFDVISFDIFDTLLLRPYLKPHDLWQDLERREGAAGFARDREAADLKCYAIANREGREPTLDEVYALIPNCAGMKAKELELERNVLTANPEMVQVWKKAGELGKRRVIVSDMYHSADFLEKVLREKGIDGWDGFFVSSDRQKKKRTGELFQLMLSDMGVHGEQVFHIGDNPKADVEIANREGIPAYLYVKVPERFLEGFPFVRAFLSSSPTQEKGLYVGALALGWHLFACGHPEWTYWHRLGFLFAGTLGYAYMKWAGERAREKGIDHFMMVARDGYILEKISHVVNPDIRTDYFYASRFSAMFAMQYFGSFGKGVGRRRQVCMEYLEKKEGVHFSEDEKKVFLETGEMHEAAKKVFDAVSVRERKSLEKYFGQFKINSGKTALVDGTSGHFTVQRLLGTILGRDVYSFYLQTIFPPKNAETLYQCPFIEARFLGFSEFLLGAPTPPVERVEGGRPVFKPDPPFFERFKMSVCPHLEEGAIACAVILHRFGMDVSKLMWLDWNDAFMDNQSLEDREMLSLARDSIAPGHAGGYFSVIPPPEPEKTIRIFGRAILGLRWQRIGETRYRVVYLFRRWPILKVRKWLWSGLRRHSNRRTKMRRS